MSSGLNKAQREIVKQMVANGTSGDKVRSAIDDMVQSDNWDEDENVKLCSQLAGADYVETAKHLEKKINR
jgi:hypothetical protein